MTDPAPILCLGTTPAAQRVMVFRQLLSGEVNRAVTTLDGAAGKSINVAKVLRTLGAQVVATGFLGGERGAELRTQLAARGVMLEFVTVTSPTRQCITLIDESTGLVTELVEESRPVEAADYEALLAIVRQRLGSCRAVIMSGTIASGGPTDLYARCTDLAGAAGVPSVVDASGRALAEALRARPGLVKPNRKELEATLGHPVADEAAVLAGMRELRERGAAQVVVTAGSKPTLAFDGERFWRIPSPRVKALNPIGSGDSFTAAMVWRLAQGDNLGEACRWGAAAGAANALSLMPGELDLNAVERLAREVTVEGVA